MLTSRDVVFSLQWYGIYGTWFCRKDVILQKANGAFWQDRQLLRLYSQIASLVMGTQTGCRYYRLRPHTTARVFARVHWLGMVGLSSCHALVSRLDTHTHASALWINNARNRHVNDAAYTTSRPVWHTPGYDYLLWHIYANKRKYRNGFWDFPLWFTFWPYLLAKCRTWQQTVTGTKGQIVHGSM